MDQVFLNVTGKELGEEMEKFKESIYNISN